MIGRIFSKLGRGENLTASELSELELFGNRSQINLDYIDGLQSGASDINANNIKAYSAEFRYPPYGLSASLYTGGQVAGSMSIPTSSATDLQFVSKRYDDFRGFTDDATTFRIPFSGKYFVTVLSQWSSVSGGIRQTKLRNVGYGYMYEYDVRHSSSANSISNFLFGEVSLVGGSDISIEVYQTSGSSVNCHGSISIRLVRNYDGDIV